MSEAHAYIVDPASIFRPDILSEPHGFLRDLRDTQPVARVAGENGNFYLVTSYALIEECSRRSEDFSSAMGHILFDIGADAEILSILTKNAFMPALLLTTDDPAHKRYRSLVNAVFSSPRLANLAPKIEQLTDELIDGFIERGSADFVNEFAVLLPTYVIADILGLPRDRFGLLRTWSDSVIRIVSRMGTREEMLNAARDVVAMRGYILQTVRERRQQPADDLITLLIQARAENAEPLADHEVAPLAFEVAVAGNETTRNTFMSGIVRLLLDPAALTALKADPALTPNAVEELLRYETPASSMWRVAARDTMLGGVAIKAGAALLLRFDAGNRDPARFADPDTFDIRRANARVHQSFGGGNLHRCLGQMLARKELDIGFRRLIARLDDLHLIDDESDINYWPGLLHRGVSAIRIGFTPAARVAG